MMETDFRTLLVADSAVAAIVGTRVQWSKLDQATAMPAMALFLIDSAPGYHFGGSDNLHRSRVQVDMFAGGHQAALSLRDAVDALLSGYLGTVAGTRFLGIFKLQERQTFERPDNVPGLHRISTDFDVWHSATS